VVLVSNYSLKDNEIDFLQGEIKRKTSPKPSQDEAPSKYIIHIPFLNSSFLQKGISTFSVQTFDSLFTDKIHHPKS